MAALAPGNILLSCELHTGAELWESGKFFLVARKRKEMKKARYLQTSHNCLQSAFASTDKYAIYLINLFGQEGNATAHQGLWKEAHKCP